jgi:hypothetical protein
VRSTLHRLAGPLFARGQSKGWRGRDRDAS